MTKKIDSQNCKNLTFKVIFLRQKLSKSLWKKNSLKNINLGQQLLLQSFFDKFNFENNLLLKLGCEIEIFLNLTTLFEKLLKKFWHSFYDSTSISFILISFHQIPLTWWNAYVTVGPSGYVFSNHSCWYAILSNCFGTSGLHRWELNVAIIMSLLVGVWIEIGQIQFEVGSIICIDWIWCGVIRDSEGLGCNGSYD